MRGTPTSATNAGECLVHTAPACKAARKRDENPATELTFGSSAGIEDDLAGILPGARAGAVASAAR